MTERIISGMVWSGKVTEIDLLSVICLISFQKFH